MIKIFKFVLFLDATDYHKALLLEDNYSQIVMGIIAGPGTTQANSGFLSVCGTLLFFSVCLVLFLN